MTEPAAVAPSLSPLGIIAGSGDLPKRIVGVCQTGQRPYLLLAFEHVTDPQLVQNTPHRFIGLGTLGAALEELRSANVHEVVLAGSIARPKLSDLKLDATSARLLKKLGSAILGGDDRILSTIVVFLEEEGFTVIGADTLLNEELTPSGALGKLQPSTQAKEDIALGRRVLQTLGPLDIGQAVVVQQGRVLGIEAAEGTATLIARCALLQQEGAGAVLVKLKKPGQERRVDLPAIGVETIEQAGKAGFGGIAVQAGHSLIIDRRATTEKADALKLFLIGIP